MDLYRTFYDNMGCQEEVESFVPRTGMSQCCPSGYICEDDLTDELGGVFVCVQNLVECGDINEQTECAKEGCFWIAEGDGICVSNPRDYSCSIYQSETSCVLDVWNVGAAGMGTEVCGTYFVVDSQGYIIPQDTCRCDWDSVKGCRLGYDVKPDIYSGTPDTFRCLKDFTTGDCIDGLQRVKWTVDAIDGTGVFDFGGGTYDEAKFNTVLKAAGCETNNVGVDRECGAPIIRVPGFSLFSLIASVGIVTLIYAFKQNHKD